MVTADRIGLLGHSEGCLIAAELSLREPVSGIVLLCPFVEEMRSILLRQAAQLQNEVDRAKGVGGAVKRSIFSVLGQPLASQRKLIAKLESSTDDVFRIGFQKVPAKWLRELIEIDAGAVYAQLRVSARTQLYTAVVLVGHRALAHGQQTRR